MERLIWVDCVKAVAILAVIVDHTYTVLYENQKIQISSFFSVSLFILMMGVTTWISEERQTNVEKSQQIRKRIKKIGIPYVAATFIYTLVEDRFFEANEFLKKVVFFNATGPFYYVALYLQLIVINVFLYDVIKKSNESKYSVVYKAMMLILMLPVASWAVNYSNIYGIYGGGGKLLGGTYFLLSYVGMLIAPWLLKKKGRVYLGILTGISSMLLIRWYLFVYTDNFHIDSCLSFGLGKNPPSVTLAVMAILVLLFSYGVFSLWSLSNNKFVLRLENWISMIGKNSLYIFLYHRLILDYYLKIKVNMDNMWMKRFIYPICMVGIPIVGRMVYIKIKNMLLSGEKADQKV